MALRAVEKWLDEGWSAWRIGYGTVGFVALVVTVVGYATHPHHPRAAWWVAAAVAVIAIWALLEMLRARTRHSRLKRHTAAVEAERDVHKAALKVAQEAYKTEHVAHNVTKSALRIEQECPVSPEHRERVRSIARMAVNSVYSSMACRYSNDERYTDHDKSTIASHFPAAVTLLDNLDSALVERTTAHVKLLERISADIDRLMGSAPWHPEKIRFALGAHIEKCSSIAGSGELEPTLEIIVNGDAGYWRRRDYMLAVDIPGIFDSEIFNSKGVRENAIHYQAEFEEWFKQIRTSPEFGRLRTSWSSDLRARRAALEAMREIELRAEIYGQCSECAPPYEHEGPRSPASVVRCLLNVRGW